MEQLSVNIDGQYIVARKGAAILEVALANNIYIPHLCYHPDLKPAGSCRVCLVELDKGQLVTSCRTPAKDGMIIKTNSPEIDKVRRPVIEMIIANHHMDCKNCAKKGQCELQRIRAYMKIDKKSIERLRLPQEELPKDLSNPFFERDHNKCVLCGICVRTCQEIQKVSAIDFAGRGTNTKIAAFGDKPIAESRCESCGECVIRCPVGALVSKNLRRPTTEVKTVCPYCGVGCGIFLGIRDNAIVNVRADKDSPVNNGHLCVKGRFGLNFVHSPDRLKNPLIKMTPKERSALSVQHSALRGTSSLVPHPSSLFKEATWDEALTTVAKKLKKYKGEEFALIASAKCTNEENYIAQKFAKVVMGSNNIDTSVRLCHGPSIAALHSINSPIWQRSVRLDSEGDKGDFKDEIEKASCILIAGANITHSHPVLGLRVKKAVENGARLIVINPTEIDICRFAEIWLKPYPGTDLALIMGMCKVVVDEEAHDNSFIERHVDKFDDFKESLEDFSLGRVERITGVSRDVVEEAARIFAKGKPSAVLWDTGITQYSQGTNNVLSLINLSILTGDIKHSSGLIPLWGQNNALGTCDMGCLPDFYPGYQPVADPEIRKKFETSWGKGLNTKPGLTLTEILDATLEERIKALYIIGSDLFSSVAPSKKVKDALKKAKFIVFQDMFHNETAKFAHVILPATSFAEKDGTFTNTERRIQGIHKAIDPIGNSQPDWQILCELARKLESSGFNFNSPEEIMSEISSLTSGFPSQKDKFKFTPLQYKPSAEVSDIEYPLILTTERDLYSEGFLSKKVEGLNILRTKEFININPKDAADFEIKDGEMARVISRWGEISGEARLTGATPTGLITMDLLEEKINQLINPVLDPISKTPETKICAVRIVPQKESQHD
jgi:formate dehydrogenase (NADP+) alpha subunit